MAKPRIVLDARPLTHPQAGGFQAYVRAILRGLLERGTDDLDLFLYVDREPDTKAQKYVPPGATVRILSADRLRTDLRLFRDQVRQDRPALIHGTVNYLPFGLTDLGAALMVTIHDAMGVKRYAWDMGVPRTLRERIINRYWAQRTRASARQACRVVTVSNGSAKELQGALSLPAEKLSVIYSAVSLPPPCPEESSRKKNSLLAIASPDPRKNIALLYRALKQEAHRFPDGRAPHLDLVCSGETSARRAEEALRYNGLTDFRLLRGVDDSMMSDLYATSGVFVWPSYREGFGLPPVEAMWAGCPVAASQAPVMPEVLGNEAPAYFDPNDPAGLAQAVILLLTETPEAHRARVLAGKAQAAQYTCRRLADALVDVWKSALEKSKA